MQTQTITFVGNTVSAPVITRWIIGANTVESQRQHVATTQWPKPGSACGCGGK